MRMTSLTSDMRLTIVNRAMIMHRLDRLSKQSRQLAPARPHESCPQNDVENAETQPASDPASSARGSSVASVTALAATSASSSR